MIRTTRRSDLWSPGFGNNTTTSGVIRWGWICKGFPAKSQGLLVTLFFEGFSTYIVVNHFRC